MQLNGSPALPILLVQAAGRVLSTNPCSRRPRGIPLPASAPAADNGWEPFPETVPPPEAVPDPWVPDGGVAAEAVLLIVMADMATSVRWMARPII